MMYKPLSSEIIYQGRLFDVRQDIIRLPDSNSVQLDIVEHNGAVTMLPLDSQGTIWFVRQYRHAAGRDILELPAGTLDHNEKPEICAQRELREEIGMSAQNLHKIGEFYLAPGYSTEYMYVYLATGLHPDPLENDADEFLTTELIPVKRAFELADSGAIQDCKTLATLFLARSYLSAHL
ncbi:MAG: NUDIX hydrolase [Anaerolineales bacterium]